MIDKPLLGNPLAGGILEDPFSNITAPQQIPERYRQGYADFYKQNPDDFQRFGGQAVSYVTTPQGETIRFGDTGGAGNFRRYLESIGETPGTNENFLSTNLLEVAGGPDDSVIPDNNAFPQMPFQPPGSSITDMQDKTLPGTQPVADSIFMGNATLPDNISNNFLGDGIFNSSSETTGQYLTGPNESANVLETLKNIEQGIASLGQGGMNQSSFGGFDNNFGIGSFFPPYGGMYGQ